MQYDSPLLQIRTKAAEAKHPGSCSVIASSGIAFLDQWFLSEKKLLNNM